jgi:hypothetical protein
MGYQQKTQNHNGGSNGALGAQTVARLQTEHPLTSNWGWDLSFPDKQVILIERSR